MSTAEERADMKANPLPQEPDCHTCDHRVETESSCELLDGELPCRYHPDALHDDTLPQLEQAFNLQAKITNLQDELKEYQARYSALLEKAVASKIETEGAYVLVDKKRSVRVPDPVKFKELFAEAYAIIKKEDIDRQLKKIDEVMGQDLTTIPVKRAEELVGKIPLTKISEEKVYHNYSIQQVEVSS